jgi:hypothetical protein
MNIGPRREQEFHPGRAQSNCIAAWSMAGTDVGRKLIFGLDRSQMTLADESTSTSGRKVGF